MNMTPPAPSAQDFLTLRHDWSTDEVLALWEMPFADLMALAHAVHVALWPANAVQQCTLLSIKTGGCPEDCRYCSQSARYDTGLERQTLLSLDDVLAGAREARDQGATRYCMGAAWRNPKGRQFEQVLDMVRGVKALGMETCVTLGMLDDAQTEALREAGLDYYNHNIDTSAAFYGEVITTRSFDDRLQTLERVREAGIHVCSGGILGLGESRLDRVEMFRTLANLAEHPSSVPVNLLVRIPGTPMGNLPPLEPLELPRAIAVARLTMPRSWVRLSAGREAMSDELQAWCYFAGANSIFFGPRLLTTDNPEAHRDAALLARLGMRTMAPDEGLPAADRSAD
jgi:biotin synthase